jgi:hypothetical protein
VIQNPSELMPLFNKERDDIEQRWLTAPPCPAEAFKEGDRLLAEWTSAARQNPAPDTRPWWVRRYWSRRNRWAGLG